MALRRLVLFLATALALVLPGAARAAGGNYVFDGGTPVEQAQVRSALDASAFDWGVVPAQVTIHVQRGTDSHATPGQIWLDADLVDAGRFAWGPIQHEYAHQVDFFLLTGAQRLALLQPLGASTWWAVGLAHSALGGERFASNLAWAYWPVRDNSLRPALPSDEAGGIKPARFRALLSALLPLPPAR